MTYHSPYVTEMRKRARRTFKSASMEEVFRRLIVKRDQHPPGSLEHSIADYGARTAGARATAYLALADGHVRRARVCHAVALKWRRAFIYGDQP